MRKRRRQIGLLSWLRPQIVSSHLLMNEIRDVEAPTKPTISVDNPNISKGINLENKLDSVSVPQLSLEQLESLRTKGNLESEIKNMLSDWVEKVSPEVANRLGHFGIDQTKTSRLMSKIMHSFRQEISEISNPEEVENIKEKTKKLLRTSDEETITQMQSNIDQLSDVTLLDLIKRKLTGNINVEEKTLLSILGIAKTGGFGIRGTHDPLLGGEIKMVLLSPESLDNYLSILQHELTHYGLNKKVPQALNIRIAGKINRASGNSNPNINNFVGVLSAIDESAAFRAQAYFGTKVNPSYEAYANQISPEMFKLVHEIIVNLGEGKTLDQFDTAIINIYSTFALRYSQDLTQEQYSKATSEFIRNL